MAEERETRWLLLIHQIPPKPDYFRVKIWRRLQRVGAVAIKNSVYVLPKSDQTLEDFQWILREIAEGGGEASLCEAGFVEGLSDSQIEALFRAARDADYGSIADEARELSKKFHPRRADEDARSELETDASRLRKRLAEVAALDFFDSLGRQTAEGLVSSLEARVRSADNVERRESVEDLADYRKRVWVTRKGIHIDRMGSAWLIKRSIDPDARFTVVPARGYRPEKGEIRFDMFDAEFTHEGDRCTFEVLIARLVPNVGGVRTIAEIIHDIDLKDSKFERIEAAGIDALITGICTHYK
ncbi:MAG: ChrB protein, partial [Candidatus Binatus sp.]|nr:ChrB protein [Candidatus Binatus sp.]